MSQAVAYLDTSAAVKLVVKEAESAELARRLKAVRHLLSSEILLVELRCAAQRRGVPSAAAKLGRVDIGVIMFSHGVRERAGDPFDPPQRALDAIHLATALTIDVPFTFVSYDEQQLAAAAGLGLVTASPS